MTVESLMFVTEKDFIIHQILGHRVLFRKARDMHSKENVGVTREWEVLLGFPGSFKGNLVSGGYGKVCGGDISLVITR